MMAYRDDEEAHRARLAALERRAEEADALARRVRELEAENLALRSRLEQLESESRPPADDERRRDAGGTGGSSDRVLVVDGDSAFVEQVRALLERQGLRVLATGDGAEAQQLARSRPPCLILLCAELRGMNGYSVCNKLKRDDELQQIPLVLVSAQASEETFEQHKKLRTRADEYLLKPCSTAALAATIGRWIDLPREG